MGTRTDKSALTLSHSQKKLQHSTSAPTQNLARSRPFAVQAQPEANTTEQQATPDLQTQLETAQRFGHSFSKISASTPSTIQPKLTIGAPGDQYEQEADRVAQQVVQRLNDPKVESTRSAETVQRESMHRNQKVIAGIGAIALLFLGALYYRKYECNRAIEQQAIVYDAGINGSATNDDLIAVATYRKRVCGN